MQPVGTALNGLAGLVVLVCYVLVVIKMFQNGESTMGIVCLVTLCCGIGPLIAFVYGWMKAGQWGITTIMWIWSVAWLIGIAGAIMAPPQVTTTYQVQ